MPNGHSVACADAARTTPKQCKCKCGGQFHGGPHTDRGRALVWDPEKRGGYSNRRLSVAKRSAREALAADAAAGVACTDFAVTHAVHELIRTTDISSHDLAVATINAAVAPFVAGISEAKLGVDDAKKIVAVVNHSHALCSLCVQMLEMIARARKITADTVADVATTVVASVRENIPFSDAVHDALHDAVARSCEALAMLAADPSKVLMLRLVGFMACPDVSVHPEVYRHCVRPLIKVFVTEAMAEWIENEFPQESQVLRNASGKGRRHE